MIWNWSIVLSVLLTSNAALTLSAPSFSLSVICGSPSGLYFVFGLGLVHRGTPYWSQDIKIWPCHCVYAGCL